MVANGNAAFAHANARNNSLRSIGRQLRNLLPKPPTALTALAVAAATSALELPKAVAAQPELAPVTWLRNPLALPGSDAPNPQTTQGTKKYVGSIEIQPPIPDGIGGVGPEGIPLTAVVKYVIPEGQSFKMTQYSFVGQVLGPTGTANRLGPDSIRHQSVRFDFSMYGSKEALTDPRHEFSGDLYNCTVDPSSITDQAFGTSPIIFNSGELFPVNNYLFNISLPSDLPTITGGPGGTEIWIKAGLHILSEVNDDHAWFSYAVISNPLDSGDAKASVKNGFKPLTYGGKPGTIAAAVGGVMSDVEVKLNITRTEDGSVEVSWPNSTSNDHVLEKSDSVQGPWEPVTNARLQTSRVSGISTSKALIPAPEIDGSNLVLYRLKKQPSGN